MHMRQCQFCNQEARELGGVTLITPGQMSGSAQTAPPTASACVNCLTILATTLDNLRDGKILLLVSKLQQSGMVRVV